MRILFLGESWYGSFSRSIAQALRRKGCDLIEVSSGGVAPPPVLLMLRAMHRVIEPLVVSDYNQRIRSLLGQCHAEVLLAIKGLQVHPDSLDAAVEQGAFLVNYFPDVLVPVRLLERTLPSYDIVFHAHESWGSREAVDLGIRRSCFLPFGYDPEIHAPRPLRPQDEAEFICDVSFVGTHTPHKERVLDELLRMRPDLDLAIRGSSWMERCSSSRVRACVRGGPLVGELYAKAITGARINLAILAGYEGRRGSKDETTMRTFEIPAVGGFALHERTEELRKFFTEDEDIVCFEQGRELAEKIDFYLAHPEERSAIGAAGRARCVPDYSYDARAETLLRHIEEHR